MNLIIQIVTETTAGQQIEEISRLEREEACLENIGMTLREGKTLLATANLFSTGESPGARILSHPQVVEDEARRETEFPHHFGNGLSAFLK